VCYTGPTISYVVEGTITVHNPGPGPATIESITDVISGGIAAEPQCGVTFPYTLAGGATLTCTYKATLPNDCKRVNTATVTPVGGDPSPQPPASTSPARRMRGR